MFQTNTIGDYILLSTWKSFRTIRQTLAAAWRRNSGLSRKKCVPVHEKHFSNLSNKTNIETFLWMTLWDANLYFFPRPPFEFTQKHLCLLCCWSLDSWTQRQYWQSLLCFQYHPPALRNQPRPRLCRLSISRLDSQKLIWCDIISKYLYCCVFSICFLLIIIRSHIFNKENNWK